MTRPVGRHPRRTRSSPRIYLIPPYTAWDTQTWDLGDRLDIPQANRASLASNSRPRSATSAMSSERALRTRRRATHGSSGQQDDGAAENEKDEKGPKSFHLEQPIATETKSDEPPKATTGSRLRDRMRSPMLGSMKLDDLKDQISKSVEVKQVCSLLRENLVDEVRFAPLHIPPHRRLQTAAVAFWAVAMPLCLFLFLVLMCAALILACWKRHSHVAGHFHPFGLFLSHTVYGYNSTNRQTGADSRSSGPVK